MKYISLYETFQSDKLLKKYTKDPLYGLKQHAKKYDNFEKFSHDYSIEIHHGIYWHITDNPNFTISKDVAPRDMSSMSAGSSADKGALMITSDLENWDFHYNYNKDEVRDVKRPYAAQIDLTDLSPKEIRQSTRGFGNEIYLIPSSASKAKVVKVMPIDMALKQDEEYHKLLPQSEEKLKELWVKARNSDPEDDTDYTNQYKLEL